MPGRGRPPKWTQCVKCPHDKKWMRKQIRRRRKMDLCPDHFGEIVTPKVNAEWPDCPNCKKEMDNYTFTRKPDYMKSLINCVDCGFATPVVGFLSDFQIKMHVKPIDRFA